MKVKNSFAAAEKRIIILLLLIKAVDCGSGEDNDNLCQISYPTICTSRICFFASFSWFMRKVYSLIMLCCLKYLEEHLKKLLWFVHTYVSISLLLQMKTVVLSLIYYAGDVYSYKT